MPLKRFASVPMHPVILAGVVVAAAFFDVDVSLRAALRPILISLIAALLVTVVGTSLLGWRRGPIAATLAIVVLRSGDLLHAGVAAILVAGVVGLWIVARRILPPPATLRDPVRLLNAAALFLVAGVLVSAATSGAIWRIDIGQGRPFASETVTQARGQPERPDIYLILLDGYPRADTLERLFGFDNTPFLDGLRDRGFGVAERSRSNYMYTAMTLTSMLHMTYIQDIPEVLGGSEPNGASLRTLINRNPVWEKLRSLGYQVAANQAPWESVAMRDADLFCGDEINEFELHLLRTTLTGPIVNALNPSFAGDQHRAVINQAFDCLAEFSAPTKSPKFVYIHVGGPHLPIVFTQSGGSAGRDVFGHTSQELTVTHGRFVSAYTEEVEYLNDRVMQSVDALGRRPDAPIIIVMSDHGSESRLEWRDASKSDLAERFSNLFAWTTLSQARIPDDMTPVNLFPIMFNALFDAGLPVRDSRYYLSPTEHQLDFTEILDPDLGR